MEEREGWTWRNRREGKKRDEGENSAPSWVVFFRTENHSPTFQPLFLTRAVNRQHICIYSNSHREGSKKGKRGFLYEFTHAVHILGGFWWWRRSRSLINKNVQAHYHRNTLTFLLLFRVDFTIWWITMKFLDRWMNPIVFSDPLTFPAAPTKSQKHLMFWMKCFNNCSCCLDIHIPLEKNYGNTWTFNAVISSGQTFTLSREFVFYENPYSHIYLSTTSWEGV